jgi:peptidoglycan/LPS O-acetylase OafA/YrhL
VKSTSTLAEPSSRLPPLGTEAPSDPRHSQLPAGGTRAHDASALAYVPPLDGLRACAVLAVMLYHGGVALSGGFLGVDTFFVLSGFLITTLLVREFLAKATITLGAFWARRARRLLPALLLVLLFVAAYATFAVPAGTYPNLRVDSLFTLFYGANWHFIFAGANYFNATGPPSPLTHTWSLGVEEQFYLLWPLIVLGVFMLARRRALRGLRLLLVVSLVGAVASAIEMAVLWNGSNQTRLYYGTDTHAQCLLVGASLALLLTLASHARARRWALRRGPGGDPGWVATSERSRSVLTWLGVAGAVITAVLWTQSDGNQWWLYHGGFLLAALSTAAVLLAAVCAPSAAVARVLSVAPLRYIGRISYGMYLWHFPLFLWLDHSRTGLSGWSLFGLRFLVTVGVATCSYYLLERPIRQRTLFKGRRSMVLAPLSVATVAAVLVTAIPAATSTAQLASGPASQAPKKVAGGPVTPAMSTVLVVGDSMAETLANGVGGAVGQFFGLNVVNGGDANCSLAMGTFEVENYGPNPSAPACNPTSGQAPWPVVWQHLVRKNHPAVSVFLARLDVVNRLFDGQWVHIGNAAYDHYLLARMRLAVRVLTSKGGKAIFLTSPYYDTGEQPNGAPWPEDNPARVDRYNAMLEQVAAEFPGKAFVIDLNKIADPNGHFQAVIDGVDVRFTDGIHWTFQGDCWLAPRLLPLIATVAKADKLPTPPQAAAMTQQAEKIFPTSTCPSPN